MEFYNSLKLRINKSDIIEDNSKGDFMAKKVLIVDDDADIRTFVVTVLEEHGYDPLIAKNGEEGMELVKKEKPDLVVLDILMPKQSGIKMYRELKSDDKYVVHNS